MVGHLANAVTQVATYTELYEGNPTGSSNHRVEFAYDLSSPAQTLSWTSTNTNSVGVAFEVKEPAGSTQNLAPPLLTNSTTLYAPQVNLSVAPPLLSNSSTLYAPQVNLSLAVPLLSASPTLYAPTVSQVGGTQNISLPQIANSQTFFAPTVNQKIQLPLVANASSLFAPSISNGSAAISLPLLTSNIETESSVSGRIYWFICTTASYPSAVPVVAGSQAQFNRKSANAIAGLSKSRHEVGDLLPRTSSNPVNNHLLCDGSEVSRTAFPQLFAAIGDAWGAGDGTTTFNIPNLVGATLPNATTAPAQTIADTTSSTGGTVVTPSAPAQTGGARGGNYQTGGRSRIQL
jgi:hypothetical protein